MSEFQKVLVVDDGARNSEHALSAELAELGFASVTTSLEATDDVLELLSAPTAIVLQLPRKTGVDYKRFMDLADRLKARASTSGIPIIFVEGPPLAQAGGYASVLQSELGAHALSKPER
jgi:hypothetical protein